ncbi:MAG: AMP-binding protein [Sulfurimonas sp.]
MNYPYENLENFTLPSLLNRSVNMYENEPALAKVGKEAMRYGELKERVQEMVQLLKENGISKGDKVVLLSENMPNWGVAYFSITYFGAVVVPILPDFHPSDVHHILRHSEAKAAFASEKYLATIEESAQSNLKLVINLDTLEIVSELSSKDYLSAIKQRTKEMTQRISNSVEKPQEDDLAAIIYTSGTTGHSKGVMLSHKNLVTNALSAYNKVTITKEDVFLSILPLAHTFECTAGFIVPILHGSSVYYIDKVPTPSVLLKAFEVVRPTMMFSVPLIIEKIYKNKVLPKFTGSFIMRLLYKIPIIRKILNNIAGKKLLKSFGGRLRFFGIGGAGLSPFVEQFLIEAEFPYIIGYGLTETSPLIVGSRLGDKPRFKSTGTPFSGVEIQIRNKDPQTGEGEIIVKSPSVMLGYYKDEAKTAEVMEDGWFLTGDLGYIDEDGYLYISGRSKNVIIGAGGENIFPEQIEAIINQQEAVLDSLVLQQEDRLIARIHLDYELLDKKFRANTNPDAKVKEEINTFLEQMRNEVNSQLASYSKIVKFVEQIEPFVKTPTKKIKRYLYTS